EELVVTRALRGLPDEGPADIALRGHQVEVLKVAEKGQRPLAGAAEKLGMKALWLVLGRLAVAFGKRLQRQLVLLATACELAAEVVNIDLVLVRARDLVERAGELGLSAVHEPEIVSELHQPAASILAA